MSWPVTSGWKKLTGIFGEDRGSHKHGGLDMAVTEGTTVKAALDGKVISSAPDPQGYGTYIVLQHNTAKQSLHTLYAHLSKKLISGGVVRKGGSIGLSGNTGSSRGPHLHFEVQRGGQKLNPDSQIGYIHNVHKWFNK